MNTEAPKFPEHYELFNDSKKTFQSCGLLPSELLKQNKQLRELLENIYQDYLNTGEDIREVKVRIGKYLESTNH